MDQNAQRENEQRIIEDLFGKLRQAEHQTGPRDATAEQQIAAAVARQPAAPYYMAQAILVQESAIETLGQRVQELEQELASRSSGGGFLDSLFGAPTPSAGAASASAGGAPGRSFQASGMGAGMQTGQANRAGGGFLGSALQTAVAVAGGLMAANLLTGLFIAEETQAAETPAEDAGLDAQYDQEMMDDGDMGDFDGFDDF
jgi:hypothetical protein